MATSGMCFDMKEVTTKSCTGLRFKQQSSVGSVVLNTETTAVIKITMKIA